MFAFIQNLRRGQYGPDLLLVVANAADKTILTAYTKLFVPDDPRGLSGIRCDLLVPIPQGTWTAYD
jgi:hypothetical protein